jgi:hypothetical protein
MKVFESSAASVAEAFGGVAYLDAELMYRPRPEPGRARVVFDYALHSRLAGLGAGDGVLFICNSAETVDSLAPIAALYPHLRAAAIIVNPALLKTEKLDTPYALEWESPASWRQYEMTDRWKRIQAALHIAGLVESPGYLVMPAHDAVWGKGLLVRLRRFSEQHTQGGLPAAVSPYTYHQHSPVPGASIPPEIIYTLNTAFGRDALLGWKIRLDRVQGFWGKMGMIPFGMCRAVWELVETFVWEDDLEIDRVIRELGYAVRAMYVRNPALYRQALPVFDHDGLRKVIERTLHYSLNIPGNSSALTFPLGALGHVRRLLNPHFARYNTLAEEIVKSCEAEIRARLARYGASWVDWGAYRYVMRPGDPVVQVWKHDSILV